jgi:hypothetical protein
MPPHMPAQCTPPRNPVSTAAPRIIQVTVMSIQARELPSLWEHPVRRLEKAPRMIEQLIVSGMVDP